MFECKVCGVSKVRTQVGTYKSGGPILVDDRDRTWNGRTCPSCHNLIIGAHRKARSPGHYTKKAKDSSKDHADPREYGPIEVLYPPKLRACRTCRVMNPNYYECDPCRSKGTQGLDDYATSPESKCFRAGFNY